jgi:signal transduction histidine kinase
MAAFYLERTQAPSVTGARTAQDSVVLAAVATIVALSALILAGWSLNSSVLKSGIPGQAATQPLLAMSFLICGLSLGLSTAPRGFPDVLMRVGVLAVLVLVVATFWQNALDTDWGLDRFFFTDAVVHEQSGPYLRAGRPAASALITLALWCCCVLLVRTTSRLGTTLYVWFATAGSLFAATVLLAYAFSLHSLYAMGLYAQVGLNTGLCLAVLFAGVLLRRADLGWMSLLIDDSVGAVSTRRLLLWTVSLLIVLTAIVQLGSSQSLYGAEFEITLVTIGSIGLLCAGLLSHARRLNELDRSRRGVANELRMAEEGLARADRHKDEFLAVLAHELRNPLAPLRNGIEIVRQMSGPDRALTRTVEMMTRQMNHLVRLVDDLLDVSRITHGAFELRRQRVTLQDVVERGVESCRPFIDALGHQLVVNMTDERIVVDGDPNRLVQVMSNLLSNSAKYTDRGGHIEVNLKREHGDAVVAITDSGIGIAPDSLEQIFEMFAPMQPDRRRSEGGLGIGLALARNLVQMHGGKLTAHSHGPGTGSTFIMSLPEAQEAARGSPAGSDGKSYAAELASADSSGPPKLKVLIADDNADAAATLALLLQIEGHQVQTASDGPRAVEMAELFHPDIVFMDLGMPGFDGAEAARQIRTHAWGRRIRIVALTGWGHAAQRRRTAAAGFDLHLVKPVDPGALSAILMADPPA